MFAKQSSWDVEWLCELFLFICLLRDMGMKEMSLLYKERKSFGFSCAVRAVPRAFTPQSSLDGGRVARALFAHHPLCFFGL